MLLKNFPMPFKIILIIFLSAIFLILSFKLGDLVYCNTVAICDYGRPAMSPEEKSSIINFQYNMAIQDINVERYQFAKQRLEYILYLDPEHNDAEKELSKIDEILRATQMP